jgi:hypothetical protein
MTASAAITGGNHVFGVGALGGGVSVITVWQLRQENVSTCAVLSFDLLPTIENPHSGHRRTGECGAGIES